MTEAQKIQYNRFVAAGYPPKMAAQLIAHGAWLGTLEMLPETIANINRYRTERDARAAAEPADAGPGS